MTVPGEIPEAKDENTQEKPPFYNCLEVSGIKVNIYSPLDNTKEGTYGIPCSRIIHEEDPDTQYTVIHTESDFIDIDCNLEKTNIHLECPSSLIKRGEALLHLAVSLTERERQLNSQILTHGAAMSTQEGKGILLLGNQGSGKTTLVVNMGLQGDSLIGNDQVIFGKESSKSTSILLFGGTKYITIRESAILSGHIPLKDICFSDNGTSPWDKKKVIDPQSYGIQVCNDKREIAGVFIVHIDPTRNEKTQIKKVLPNDIYTNLFLGEKFARHISGVATHLLSDEGFLLSHTPSLDDKMTRNNRINLIHDLYQLGIYKISGSNIQEMIDIIRDIC
jgi:energy-coupling factor transporter ATP-binding protein EcfA2